MVQVVCAIRDAKAEIFGQPFFSQTIGIIIRSFADEVNREGENNQFYKHPEDYGLYQLGTYDDNEGKFVNLGTPKLLVLGNEVKEAKVKISKV